MMDQKTLLQLEEQCIQNQPPACAATCPVHVAAQAMVDAAARGAWDEARREFTRAVPFPHIIARCCDAPCEGACVREAAGGAIRIRALERAAMAYGAEPPAATTMRRAKPGRIAVVGAGLSGLSAAYELARKGYSVVVFEAEDAPGGRARELVPERLSAAELAADIAKVAEAGAQFVPFTAVALARPRGANALASLAPEVDAIYLAMGAAEADAGAALGYALDERGRIRVDPVTLATSRPGTYCGGSILRPAQPWSPIAAIADGRRAALSIERQLQHVSLGASRGDRGSYETRLVVSLEGVESLAPVPAAESARGYSRAEAASEAGRCLACACLACVRACAYLEHYGAYPGLYARTIYNNLAVTKGTRPFNKMIDSCSLCRLCYEVCPTDLDMAAVIRAARREMVRQGRMPPSAFGFAVEDLRLALSERAVLARHAPGTQASTAVFFPGCQLAASDPAQVERVYAYLRERYAAETGILLYCCGAPADWAGRDALFAETLEGLRGQLAALAARRVILACPTCQTVFAAQLPEVETVSLYEVLAETGLPAGASGSGAGRRVALHDSCTARYQGSVQRAVRELVGACGYELTELPLSRERTECCGFGGLMLYANPELAELVTARRIASTSEDLVAYCAMCRDRFAAAGRPTSHVLDLVFGSDYESRAARRGPPLTQRSEQRVLLKERLLAGVWGEALPADDWREQLLVSTAVMELLERRYIRPQEVLQVVRSAARGARYFLDEASGRRLAALQLGSVTYWVEYEPEEGRWRIHSAYSHRMEIKPPPWPPAEGLEANDGRRWRCAAGEHPLEARTVTLSYLVAGIPVKLLTCVEHGMALVPEALATGRMREVELALEDK